MIRRPPRSTRTDTLFPYTTLFRSISGFDISISGNGWERSLTISLPRSDGRIYGRLPAAGRSAIHPSAADVAHRAHRPAEHHGPADPRRGNRRDLGRVEQMVAGPLDAAIPVADRQLAGLYRAGANRKRVDQGKSGSVSGGHGVSGSINN